MQHNTKPLKIFILTVCILATVICACACGRNDRISLTSFVSVSHEGLSGDGTATLTVDWEGIIDEVLGVAPTKGSALQRYQESIKELEDSLTFVLSQTEDLANGDVVTVSIVCNDKVAAAHNLKIYESFTVELDQFVHQIEIDLFKALEVTFSGFSPDVTATLQNTSTDKFLETVTFFADQTENLAIGSEILVTATYSQELADTFGYAPLSTTKTYTVRDVAYYPYAYKELPSDLIRELTSLSLAQVKERWEDYDSVILSVLGSDIDRQPYLESTVTDIQIKDSDLVEIILLSRNDTEGSWFGSYNYLFFVYKTVVNDSVLKKDVDIYQCVVFSDIFIHETGEVQYEQWNVEKPQYEKSSSEAIQTLLTEEYALYKQEVILK